MNYKQLRDFSLQLINRYSIAGAEIPGSYNNQQDYINRIPGLINDGLMYAASTVRPLRAQRILDPAQGEDWGQWLRFLLPEDCLFVRPGGLLLPLSRQRRCTVSYVLQEPDILLAEKPFDEPAVLEYHRRPQLLPDRPDEKQGIDAQPEVQAAIAYYTAAHLAIHDDPFLYASLYSEFETRLARLRRPADTETAPVRDCYGMDGWGDGYD